MVLAGAQTSGHLPLDVTSFVDRRQDRSRLRKLMEASRLVTLTGFGGIGKTRLALRVAHDLRRVFFDGVYLVSLAELQRADPVADQVAATLGLESRANRAAVESLVEYLRDRTVLLVLDNCEHVVAAAAQTAEVLLLSCPGVRLLATSREPLRIGGETIYAVPPLSAPDPDGGSTSIDHAAVQLFVDRARAVRPDFELTESNRDAAAAVCGKLEGIPLALELAAARLRGLTPEELGSQISNQWEVLGRGSRTAPRRQSTMAACIDWSFQLCSPAERQLWAETSVFLDGFEHDAVEAVCTPPENGTLVREVLGALVDKSLLTVSTHGAVSRYRMLPPLRQRGLSELRTLGRDDEIRRRHRDFYTSLIARGRDEWFSSRQLDWIQRLRRELSNWREALNFCASEPGEARAGIQALPHLVVFVATEGLLRQGRQWCERLLASGEGEPEEQAAALWATSWWATMQGDFAAASSLLQHARDLPTDPGSEAELLVAQSTGLLEMMSGDATLATELLTQAAEGLATVGNPPEAARSYFLLSLARVIGGDIDGALATQKWVLATAESAGDIWLRSYCLWANGLAVWFRGDLQEADRLLRESLKLKRVIAERVGVGYDLEALALLVAESDPERAAVLIGAVQNVWDKTQTSTAVLPGLDMWLGEARAMIPKLLGDQAFHAAWTRGRAMDQETAISFALDEAPPAKKSARQQRGTGTPLTRRELEIAKLVYNGLSNKEIAETLVISPRTADTHVANILSKLGFTRRAQIAGWITENPTNNQSSKPPSAH